MPINATTLRQAGEKLHQAERILLVSHIRPDGDALGSLLGFGWALLNAGKQVQMVINDHLSSRFRFLPAYEEIRRTPEGKFDFIVVLDCSDLQRTGDALSGLRPPDLNIDHHITNLDFAVYNLVDTAAVSTTEIVYELLQAWELDISHDAATALLTGLVTDSLGFRTSNMTPKALETAAQLVRLGGDLPFIYQQTLVNHTFEALKYWGAGLSRLQREDQLAWTALTLEARGQAEYPGRDDADLVNLLNAIENIAVAVIFIEQTGGKVKISWRAQPGYDVSQLAVQFGGGGHPAAAGAEIAGSLAAVQTAVLTATRTLFQPERVA
ncbi:MAG TPA: bifunctional oligoribonuclease/PAP phosphatase NrnA [Anaerolineales bacterium]|nr:bifunctional oligoribonuclease/PAP phosphatase NrnA [Anaerolineales bacterium]